MKFSELLKVCCGYQKLVIVGKNELELRYKERKGQAFLYDSTPGDWESLRELDVVDVKPIVKMEEYPDPMSSTEKNVKFVAYLQVMLLDTRGAE